MAQHMSDDLWRDFPKTAAEFEYFCLFLTTVTAWFCNRRWKSILIASLLSAWTYIIISNMPEGKHLPTQSLIIDLRDSFYPPQSNDSWGDNPLRQDRAFGFLGMGHVLIGLLLGILCGFGAAILLPRESTSGHEAFPPEGRILRDKYKLQT